MCWCAHQRWRGQTPLCPLGGSSADAVTTCASLSATCHLQRTELPAIWRTTVDLLRQLRLGTFRSERVNMSGSALEVL
jgi:hypothetical protein